MQIMTNTPKKRRVQSEKKGRNQGFYIGTDTERERRLAALEQIAADLGLRGAGTVIQALADGVIPPVTLGDREDSAQRRDKLTAIAAEQGLTLSAFFRKLADGDIKIAKQDRDRENQQ